MLRMLPELTDPLHLTYSPKGDNISITRGVNKYNEFHKDNPGPLAIAASIARLRELLPPYRLRTSTNFNELAESYGYIFCLFLSVIASVSSSF